MAPRTPQLHLQVYDQRREAKLRQARDWFFKNYHVTSLDDAMRVVLAPMGGIVHHVRGLWQIGTSCKIRSGRVNE
jgi:hypothetical protein